MNLNKKYQKKNQCIFTNILLKERIRKTKFNIFLEIDSKFKFGQFGNNISKNESAKNISSNNIIDNIDITNNIETNKINDL